MLFYFIFFGGVAYLTLADSSSSVSLCGREEKNKKNKGEQTKWRQEQCKMILNRYTQQLCQVMTAQDRMKLMRDKGWQECTVVVSDIAGRPFGAREYTLATGGGAFGELSIFQSMVETHQKNNSDCPPSSSRDGSWVFQQFSKAALVLLEKAVSSVFFHLTLLACLVMFFFLHVLVCSAIIGRSTKDFKTFLFSFIKFMPLVSLFYLLPFCHRGCPECFFIPSKSQWHLLYRAVCVWDSSLFKIKERKWLIWILIMQLLTLRSIRVSPIHAWSSETHFSCSGGVMDHKTHGSVTVFELLLR